MTSEINRKPETKRSRTNSPLYSAAPWAMFFAAAALALGLFLVPGKLAQEQHKKLAERNSVLSLPSDYPLDSAPIFQGAKVESAERTDATSKEGLPMNQWDVKATSTEQPKAIYEFYKDFCSDRDMLQTQMISIPTGYSLDYADDRQILHVEVERPTRAEQTSIKLTFYELAE